MKTKVRFRDNVGSVDAQTFGLDFTKCLKHAEMEVDNDLARRLHDANLADPVTGETGQFHAVPSVDVKTSDNKK